MNCDINSFLSSIDVYMNRPNLINKRVMHSRVIKCWKLQSDYDLNLIETFSLSHFETAFCDSIVTDFNLIDSYDSESVYLVIRELFPRKSTKEKCDNSNANDAILIDYSKCEITFIPKNVSSRIIPDFTYKIYLNGNGNDIDIEIAPNISSSSSSWLMSILLPKLRKWMCHKIEGQQKDFGSLKLISIDEYCHLYQTLKERYAKQLIEIWPQNEKTDPIKFIYEDIAIASYLLVLWNDERQRLGLKEKQSFVDLGCGNGLLVYILTGEGHNGIGIDVRKRNIWDHFGPNVKLEERTFTPSDKSLLFTNYDWLIGNHSDELTPWIPFIAANSSYNMRVFLLPCCTYDFSGTKYQRINSELSQYQCYLKYITSVCECFGFNVKNDKMRIPSTKRICIVCDSRNYHIRDENEMSIKRDDFVHSKISDFSTFKPREKIETVKNCTHIPRNFLDAIINSIADMIIKSNHVTINEIAKTLKRDDLIQLKNQCGGLQTLLRNHKHVFQIINGNVRFAKPKSIEMCDASEEEKRRWKTKQCWFFHNHYMGCLLSDSQCRYKH